MHPTVTTPTDDALHDYKLDHWNISHHVIKGKHIATLIWGQYGSVKCLLPYEIEPLQADEAYPLASCGIHVVTKSKV